MATTDRLETASLATELRVVLGRLVRRLRAEHRFPVSQATVLSRLEREGPQSVSDLAAGEGMRPQSMAQTVSELESDGLVRRHPDPHDRRRALVELTEAGQSTLLTERQRREGWLARELSALSEPERAIVREALELFRRLAEG
ncbi:MAG TPA: MarR family transcriptional regulator [Solirubrobacteraceae bacterium]|nr:MarR family transcriptional regulator [Solirubrobacteraceae bacterium]